MKIEISCDNLADHATLVLPEDPDETRALICDAMSQSDEFLDIVASCLAGWCALQSDESWNKVKTAMDGIREQIKRAIADEK